MTSGLSAGGPSPPPTSVTISTASPPEADPSALPAGAVGRLGSERFRQPGNVFAVAYSPDGKWVFSTHDALTTPRYCLDTWEAATGRLVKSVPLTDTPYRVVAGP